ncbi:MAG: 2-amino-4-hydroxy-6-hydroxymethyldihydropteridine diphosphokinase [Pirellulales bacterium]
MPTCLVALGSNLGDRPRLLADAIARLGEVPGVRLVAQSRWYATQPVGGPSGQGEFLNGAVRLETSLQPEVLLAALKRIESDLGRRRTGRWQARPIDLDLLLYGEQVVETTELTLPHPRMAFRRFVLEPAAEIAADLIHPPTGWTIARLLEHLRQAVPYVAIAGPIASGKTSLAEALVDRTGARQIAEQPEPARLTEFYADPSGRAWETELEFLRQRTRLLDAARWPDAGKLAVSDFWFDQSAAFASVWLPPDRLEPYLEQFEVARRGVLRPKLLVVLDASSELLVGRIARRGRPYEQQLSPSLVERLRCAIDARTRLPDVGPVLRLAGDAERALVEVTAAIGAMR